LKFSYFKFQVCLLGSAKVVASSLNDLIVNGKLVSQKEGGMEVFSNDAKVCTFMTTAA
jgi:hypothetical protein